VRGEGGDLLAYSEAAVLTITREFGFAAASRLTSIRCLMAHRRVIKCMSMNDLSLSQTTVDVYACVQEAVGPFYEQSLARSVRSDCMNRKQNQNVKTMVRACIGSDGAV
jgi:hypothetical protein